jgi:hypothetical protein
MWGSEIYTTANRYGRYQSYGALEILYPGDKETGNGYDVDTWDWNYSPGTTVIRMPWDKLHGERERIDELQQKRFVGALTLNKKNSELLTNNHGDYGLFAMDFQEQEGLGWGTIHSSNNHNNTFTFQKSSFYFDDIIVCLGSGISNDDTTNATITTLYQRLHNSGNDVNVNGTTQASMGEVTFSGASDNWLLSNYNTGFYLLSGSHSLKVKKEVQQNPNYNQIWPVDYSSNPTNTYYTGYIDQGTNPSNESYEYIIKPGSSIAEMQALATDIQGANKPYTVHQQDANAHIVEHLSKNIWGYTFFSSAVGLTYDYVTDVDSSCLVMTKFDGGNQTLLVSLSNPDIGFDSRSYNPSITAVKRLTLQGEWQFVTTHPDVAIISTNPTETIIDFTTVDGLSIEIELLEVIGCTSEEIINDSFESGFGNWNDGGGDCARSTSNPNTGLYSIRLRDNSGTASSMFTDIMDMSSNEEVVFEFSYYPSSMENGEDFFLEISTNGGSSYSTYQTWVSGTDFNNNTRYHESIDITGITFTSTTVFRIRCDASGNGDYIYVDDVVISACTITCTGGSPCDDGEACTINDVYDVDCNCTGTPAPDNDGDGYCGTEDPDDTDPCIPDTGAPGCSSCGDIIVDGFESGFGNWNDGGNDCSRSSSNPNTGLYSVRLRDNSGNSSSMYTDIIDLSLYTEVLFEFSYYPNSMEIGEDFFLEISTNGGSSYSIYQTWVSGTDFNNNTRYNESINIMGIALTTNTVFRLRCDASANGDQVYIDDVVISDCVSGSRMLNNDGIMIKPNLIKIYPNPTSQMLFVDYSATNGIDSNFLLYNMYGQLLRSIWLNDHNNTLKEIYLDGISDGVYLIKIIDQEGHILKTERILFKSR